MTQQTEPTLDALAVRKDEGEALWWFRRPQRHQGERRGHRRPDDDLGANRAAEHGGAAARSPPEDEAFFILEGSATFQVGDQTIEAGAGDYLFGPRHVPHKYDTGPEGCRMLFICTPGGNFENIPRQMGVPAQSRTLPPPSDEEPDWERVAAIAKANGCELLA
jgi:mannose-6-phosphate isomerase-like protein (cupin superfamily)